MVVVMPLAVIVTGMTVLIRRMRLIVRMTVIT